MPPKVKREYTGFFGVVEILRGKSHSSPEAQQRDIKQTLDYLISIRDYDLFLDEKITAHDFEESVIKAGDRWSKLVTLVQKGYLNKFKFTEKNYLNHLNKHISELHKIDDLDEDGKFDLWNFLYTYQKALNSGLGNSSLI